MYDIAIIGCGIVGAAAAFELSKYDLKTVVLERYNDVSNGATKANSAILHAGYDCPNGTLEARLNVLGSRLCKVLCEKLDVERREIPSFVLAFSENERPVIEELCRRGKANGVEGLEIISGSEARKREPALSSEVVCALYAPASAIVNPWEFCIALAETAVKNGVELRLSSEVCSIGKSSDGIFNIGIKHSGGVKYSGAVNRLGDAKKPSSAELPGAANHYDGQGTGGTDVCTETVQARFVINAAGAFSANIYEMVGGRGLKQTNSCGQYYVLDKDQAGIVNSIIFQCPSKEGKGVLVAPTVHGNLIVGPDSFTVENGDCVATVEPMLEQVKARGLRSVPSINFRSTIHEYAGVRPNTQIPDFVIGEAPECRNFINLAGIRSPGLTSAPAIALEAVEILRNCDLELNKKKSYTESRSRIKFRELSPEQKAELIKKDPRYGRVICRCETITEGEIVEAIHRPVVPVSLDAIKRRCNAGLGRCQGGFCGPRVHEILARELGCPPEDILMDEEGSYIITGNIKENSMEGFAGGCVSGGCSSGDSGQSSGKLSGNGPAENYGRSFEKSSVKGTEGQPDEN